jgi:hypothetical protein
VRRLSQREYFNVVSDLLGADLAALGKPMFPLEPSIAGFDNQDAGLVVSSAYQEALAQVAETISGQVVAAQFAPCATASGSTACLEAFAKSFSRKAFGRDPTSAELAHSMSAAATGDTYEASVRLIVEVVLQSPGLVYASELGPVDNGPTSAQIALTQQEIASQLSLTFTGARPDDALLQAADASRLSRPEDLVAEVERLLHTPRGASQLHLLATGWLDLGPIASAPKDPVTFPVFTPDVANAMQNEVDSFIDQKLAGGEGIFDSFLTDVSSNIPAALAPIYGSDLQGGKLDPRHRQGILALPGVLAYHANDKQSGPVIRGLFIRRQLLCQEVPPPPPQVAQLIANNPIDPNDPSKTTRQKYEAHKTEAFCQACHGQFDPIGFGMEEIDGVGRYRTTENGLPIDSNGELVASDVDGPFNGIVELTARLLSSRLFKSCFSRQFFRFAASRPPADSEQCVVDGLTDAFVQGGGHFKDLINRYVTSPFFSKRNEDR